MLKNYLKIAWKVLLRRKLFTLISLFGISFTIMVLVIVSAEVDSLTAPVAPEINLNRCLFVKKLEVWYDVASLTRSTPPYCFLDKYLRRLKTPENISIYTAGSDPEGKNVNGEIDYHVKYTDAAFWEILKFDFIEGKAFTKKDVDNAINIAVVSESVKYKLFGSKSAIGKVFTLGDRSFRITGVVKDVLKSRTIFADVWMPLTTSKIDLKSSHSFSFEAMIMARGKADIQKIKNEFYSSLKTVDSWDDGEIKKIICPLRTNSEWLDGGKILGIPLFEISYQSLGQEQWIGFETTIIAFMCFFIILPVLNLINLNTTRIFERSSEIAIRKAFGASSLTLTGQFIWENLFLTVLGGLAGLTAAFIAIYILNMSSYFGTNLAINYRIIFYALIFVFLFGLLSGVYPAYKMSRLNPVSGLRGGIK